MNPPTKTSDKSPPTRYRTGDPELDRLLLEILDHVRPEQGVDQLWEILVSAVRLAGDGADRLDLKITNAALKEMRNAFRIFAPYRHIPKVTIFGSARIDAANPLYDQARGLATRLAERGWMVVTGAGPGIMAAGLEGAGREMSFGVNIRLPFEQSANEFIAGDEKLISMKYFFTRKLVLLKESRGFVSLPGGFGTLDETYELLTLSQTGKAEPSPIVLLDEPGGTYWKAWLAFVREQVARNHLVDDDDLGLFLVTDDVDAACEELVGFYRNFNSIRWVGDRLVIRLEASPTDEELERLNDEFADVCASGRIERTDPLAAERANHDRLDKPRLVLDFDIFRYGRLRALIDALNALPSAPVEVRPPPAQPREEE
ncbi:MAG: TIGR00730 family Rossman fold protein [Acidimicrobiales bacterium]